MIRELSPFRWGSAFLLVLSDEVSRRDGLATVTRAQRARLDPALQLEAWDPTESRDAYEILTERHRLGSMMVTSNRGSMVLKTDTIH